MKINLTIITAVVSAMFFTLTAHAALVWKQDTGWHSEGGLAQHVIGGEVEGRNALELMNNARNLQEQKSYFQALGVYDKVVEDYANSIYAPEALFQRARIYTERHQFENAIEELDKIVKLYPDYPGFNRVIGQKFEVASQLMEGKRPYYWGFIPGFRDEVAAMDYFEGIVKSAPFSRYAPVALMNVALIAKSKGKTEEAIDALDRLITSYPKSILAPDAYLNLAKTYASLVDGAYYDQGSTTDAIGYFQDFLLLYPKDENISTAEEGLKHMRETLSKSRFLVGEFYWQFRYNPVAAKVFLNDAITVAPDSESAKEARALLDRIESGETPPGTSVDWLFGKYEVPRVNPDAEQTLNKSKEPKVKDAKQPAPATEPKKEESVPPSWKS